MANERVEVAIVGSNQTDAAFREVESNLGKLEGRLGTLNSAIAGFAGGIGAAVAENIGGMLVDTFKFVTKAAEEAAISQRKLEAVLRATGNTTGYTATQLNNLADKLARTTSFDDEAFREATATIVRFGNITGENLEKVLRLSADYAALTGGSVTSAAQMFARALNDPADGLKKLERNFGELRPEAKAAVDELERVGDRSGAIALAIAELQAKIGGADESINTGLTGATKRLNKALGELAETLGGQLSGGGALQNWFATQVERITVALNATPMEKLAMLATILRGPFTASEVIPGYLDAVGRRANAPNLGLFSGMNTSLDGGDPQRVYGMGFYGPSNNEIELERRRRTEIEKLQREMARERERLLQVHVRGSEAALQAEHDLIVYYDEQRSKLQLRAMKEREQIRQIDLDGQEYLARQAFAIIQREQEAFNEGLRAVQERAFSEWVANYDRVADAGARFFTDLVFNGRKAFDNLRDALKSFAAELIAIFAKRWILNMAAAATGSTALSAAAGQVGQGTLAGATTSLFGNALGSFLPGAATGAEFFSGMMGTFMGPAAPGSAAALGGQFAAFMTNPATLAVLAAVVIAVAVMSRRGGPKDGGSAFGTFDENGNFVPGFAPGTQNGRFYTPSGADPAMVAMTEGIGTAFAETLARLGGTGAGFGFGFGFDRDPRGTANSRVSGVVTNAAGQTILEVINREAGRSDEELQEALELLGRQSLLAALQNSELPEAVRAILNMVDAASATAEQVDAILQLADAFVQFTNATASLDLDAILESGSRSPAESFRLQGQALVELANNTTLTTQSLATLTQATGAYRQSAIQLILSLEEARKTIASMFDQTRRNVLTAGLDNQSLYNFLQDDAATLFDRIMGSSSVEEILRWSNQINQNINQAFGLLSPEQQDAMRQMFLERINTVDNAVQERLRTLQNNAREEADRQLAEIRRIMTELAEKQNQAAATQQQAADTQLNAANTPRTFNINVDLQNGNTVVTDGSGG